MDPHYLLRDTSQVFSPGLLFYRDVIRHNIERLIARVGDPKRLRPHVKTHKTREINACMPVGGGHHQALVRDHRRGRNGCRRQLAL